MLPESLSVPPVGFNEMPGQTTDPRSQARGRFTQALARAASRTLSANKAGGGTSGTCKDCLPDMTR